MPTYEVKKISKSVTLVDVHLKNVNESFTIANLPDAHWDNPHCDRALFKRDLEYCKKNNIFMVFPGDFYCAMQGKYDPRRSKENIRPEHNKNNYLDLLVEDAANWMKPYVNSTNSVFGVGNHESAILKNCETDLIERFCERTGSTAMGYLGWIIYNVRIGSNTAIKPIKYYFHHGYGGGGPVTRGTINQSRTMMHIEGADIMSTGHIHEKYNNETLVMRLDTHAGKYEVKSRSMIYCQSSTYKQEYGTDGFHIERGRPPKSLGGTFVEISIRYSDNKMEANYRPYFFSTPEFNIERMEQQERGLRYNTGKRRWSLVHYKSLEPMVQVLEFGASKYDDHNWKKGMPPKEVLECLQRHLAELMDGEVNDKESGLPHIGNIMCNAMFYSFFTETQEGMAVIEKLKLNDRKEENRI